MKDPQALLSQDALEETRPSNLNLYPRKRELEAQISAANEDLTKSKSKLREVTSFSFKEKGNIDFKKSTYLYSLYLSASP